MVNLIGISGKIGSGKDTIGILINAHILCAQQKTWGHTPEQILNYYNQTGTILYNDTPVRRFHIKKFADKLKDITCMLTGCTRAELESQEFKAKELPEMWRYIPQWTGSEMIRQGAPEGWPDERVGKYTYRSMLQYVGTDLFRTQLHENVWVNALFADYKEAYDAGDGTLLSYIEADHVIRFPDWVITDCRFPNEAKAIKDHGGVMIRVNRSPFVQAHELAGGDDTIHALGYAVKAQADQHPSETGLDKYRFDYVIDNNGTVEELSEKVKQILIELKLI